MKIPPDPRTRGVALPPQPLRPLPEDDGRTYDEPIRLIRRGRLAAGLGMILLAVLLIVVQNLLGIHATPFVRPAGVVGTARPLGIAQRTAGLVLNAKLLERRPALGGHPAPAGQQYLVVAVQVVNTGTRAVPLATGDFRLLLNVAGTPGAPYPGKPLTRSVAARKAVVGFVTFLAPQPLLAAALRYTPPNGAPALLWRFP